MSIKVNIIKSDKRFTLEVEEGDTILGLKHKYERELEDLECACEGSLACSTCHVIVSEEYYPLTGEVSDDENDMLDLAYGLTRTSRLGCQVRFTRKLDGMTLTIPIERRNQ